VADVIEPRRPVQPGLFNRLRRLSAAEAALLAETFALLAFSSAAIRMLPFTRVGALASSRLGRPGGAPLDDLVAKVVWAVGACARRVPFRAVCFQQGLTAQIMLRRRGVDSTLYFGAAMHQQAVLSAHVWVKAGEIEVVGCEEASGYAALAAFPPRSDVVAPQDATRDPIQFDSIRS
jgi:hypothetical protein